MDPRGQFEGFSVFCATIRRSLQDLQMVECLLRVHEWLYEDANANGWHWYAAETKERVKCVNYGRKMHLLED